MMFSLRCSIFYGIVSMSVYSFIYFKAKEKVLFHSQHFIIYNNS